MPLSIHDIARFADRYQRACEVALKQKSERGTSGLEVEWNLYDHSFRPLETVGSGPELRSFVDALREDFIPAWLEDQSQREVFHWMIEWATKPHYAPEATVYEARLLEASLLNALSRASKAFDERLYAFHGSLLYPVRVDHNSIPSGWDLAKRRYLARCVDLHAETLATAGLHANVSLPEPLLDWDFIHLSPTQRGDGHLDSYKNLIYVEGARLLRAFAALLIATSASTPLHAQLRDQKPVLVLTNKDSIRSMTFPCPESIDVPMLYRSHEDYVRISYDLVRKGIRFGNNNWTPTRARSFAEPVERLIATTSEQLQALYREGLYALGETATVGEVAAQIEMQNLLARIDIPMARVEVRTDDGGHALDLDVANLTLIEQLLIQFYADKRYGRAFRYDAEDIARARRNERRAAADGMRAEIEHPFTGKPVHMRAFLQQTLTALQPIAEALDRWELLAPLVEMAKGAPNTAEQIRRSIQAQIGDDEIVPVELLHQLAETREKQVLADVEQIAAELPSLGPKGRRVYQLLGQARDSARRDPQAPIRFRPPNQVEVSFPNKTAEILALSRHLIRFPSVTMGPPHAQRLDEVFRVATYIYDDLRGAGLGVSLFEDAKFPALLASFPGKEEAPVMLVGHFDVVAPEPDSHQFEPRTEGDFLWGRGSADMKTVVATYLVWMKDTLRQGAPYPGVSLLLVGNEEVGEREAYGTPHVLASLNESLGYQPQLMIVGERTGEGGKEAMGKICTANRGLARLEIIASGKRGHTGVRGAQDDLTQRLFQVRDDLREIMNCHLTLSSKDGWQSQARFPFLEVGERGIYNITAGSGVIGLEIRPIPEDDLLTLLEEIQTYCRRANLETKLESAENGVVCDPDNPYLRLLVESVAEVSGSQPSLGRKLPGTSARFAPSGQAVIWGQSGLGPHAADERHYIPSIKPYYDALTALGSRLKGPR